MQRAYLPDLKDRGGSTKQLSPLVLGLDVLLGIAEDELRIGRRLRRLNRRLLSRRGESDVSPINSRRLAEGLKVKTAELFAN